MVYRKYTISMRLKMKNYYEILEVNEKASKETISKVFKMQIKKNHPDLFQGDEKKIAEEKTMLLNEAYEVLSDESKRADYDKQITYEKEEQINYFKEQIAVLKEELIKKQTILQQLREELGIDTYMQNINRQNNYVEEKNISYNNMQENENMKSNSFGDLKVFFFKLLVFLLIIIGALFMLGQILDKDLLGELFNRFLGN